MRLFIKYFECGNVEFKREVLEYRVDKFSDLYGKILPFFRKHPIRGVKLKDFEDWCKVADLMVVKSHLTLEGLEQILKIKAGMNRKRITK